MIIIRPRANYALLAVCSTLMAQSRKKLLIWEGFAVGEDTKLMICRTHKQSISFSGHNTKMYNTINPVLHLKTKHGEQYGEYEKALETGEEEKGKEEAIPQQLSLLEASECRNGT